jgi:hypothetical protein
VKIWSHAVIAVVAAVSCLCFSATAGAAIVTVGPNLSGTYASESCGTACTLTNFSLTQSGAQAVSPVSGAIVRWHVLEGTTAGTYRLRVMNLLPSGEYVFTGSGATVASSPTTGIQTFTETLPISAGQAIGLDMSATASVGVGPNLGEFVQWEPVPGNGPEPAPINEAEDAIGFNAEVQPTPVITSLATAAGPLAGGTSVTIAGTDFEGASAVSFGATAATSFTVNSESQITAVAPATATAGPVQISVTTPAGKATSSQSFNYEAPPAVVPAQCLVPKLKGKKLAAAKKALIKSHCKLGTVKKRGGATTKTGKVSKQSRSPRSTAKAGAKVNVTLKP